MKNWLLLLLLVVAGWASLTLAADENPDTENPVPAEVQESNPETKSEPSTPKMVAMGTNTTVAPVEETPEPKPETKGDAGNGAVTSALAMIAMLTSLAASLQLFL